MIRSWDIFSADQIAVGSRDHHVVMDLAAACQGPRDEEILRLRLNGATQADIAAEVGFTQSSVSRRLGRLLEWAGLDDLSRKMRDRSHQLAAAPEHTKPFGLRFGRHEGHGSRSRCWCARSAA